MSRIFESSLLSVLTLAALVQAAPGSPPDFQPGFWSVFPGANGSNRELLLRFRDEIVSAAGLEGGLDRLDLPDDLKPEPLCLFGARAAGVAQFSVAIREPASRRGSPPASGWTSQAGFLVWKTDSEFPPGLLQELLEVCREDDRNRDREGNYEIRLSAEWMGLPRPGDAQVVELPGGSLSQALASLDQVTLHGRVGSEVELMIESEYPSAGLAEVVADAWRTVLDGFRQATGGAAQVAESLGRGEVLVKGPKVSVQVPLTAAALNRLQHAQASKAFLLWQNLGYQREADEHAPQLLQQLGAIPGARLADLGAGQGFYSVRLARAVGPTGRVFAVDIAAQALEALRARARYLPNLKVVAGDTDNPHLSEKDLDGVLIVNAYHEMSSHAEILAHLAKALRPGGRLLVLEPHQPETEGLPRSDQVEKHQIAPEIVAQELEAAGFEVILLDRAFRWSQHEDHTHNDGLVVARKPL